MWNVAGAQLHNLGHATGSDHYHSVGYQGNYAATQDQKMSNQVYNGYGGGLHGGYFSYHNRKYTAFHFSGGYEYLTSPHELITHQAWLDIRYQHTFWIRNSTRKHIYLGPYIEGLAQMRIADALENNSFNWDVMTGIGPSLHAETSLGGLLHLPDWWLYSDLGIPVVGYTYRPNYALPSRESVHQFNFIGRLVRLEWQTGLKLPASKVNSNQYQIWYRWGFLYYKDNETQHLSAGRHSIGFSFLFNTKSSLKNEN